MRYLQLLFFSFLFHSFLFSQDIEVKSLGKPSLDSATFRNWPALSRFGISNDGKFVYYTKTHGGNLSKEYLTIKSLSGFWEVNISNIKGSIKFAVDNTKLFCLNSGDSLCIINLGNNQVQHIPRVRTFDIFENDMSKFLIYQKLSSDKDIICLNLLNNNELIIKNVIAYLLNVEANQMIMKTDSLVNGQNRQFLFCNKVGQFYRSLISQGEVLSNLTLNKKTNELAFIKEDNGTKSIWLSKLDSPAKLVMEDTSILKQEGLQIDRIYGFSQDGSKLFIYEKEKRLPQTKPGSIKVNVWSFTDTIVQSRQSNRSPQSYLAVLDLKNKKIIRLQNHRSILSHNQNENFIYLFASKGDENENYWNKEARGQAMIVSVNDNKTKNIEIISEGIQVSPNGKFLIGLDEKFRDLYSYEINTGKTINLTKTLPIDLPIENVQRDIYDRPNGKYSRGLNFAAWVEQDKILVYDEFDIWKIDLKGKEHSINITNGLGRKTKTNFQLMGVNAEQVVVESDNLIVTAFNKVNKKSGFFKIAFAFKNDPKLLSMDHYMLTLRPNVQSVVKAKDADSYIVQRESAVQSPNLYWTRDFQTFNRISSILPEKEYNWLTTELKSFETLDGRTEQGILYKPENFDERKSYPVIVHFYERKSDDLNKFHVPGIENGELDISWFVSHGYVVFTPDIHYTIGAPGKCVYNSVIGAVRFLKTLRFVNPAKIGAQGHSWGGYETNYLISHSRMFAAAVSSSGLSNLITGYLSDLPREQAHREVNQIRLGTSLWQDISMYIENSPVFKAYNVSTPIMLVHNKVDNNVPFVQGLEWFMALRRLGKRAWMLEYDEGGHGLGGNDYIDYVIRSTQFFDHYLKDSACPKWMLYGIPKKDKGIEDGLELVKEKDPKTGKWLTPKEGGLLTEEQKKKVEALKRRNQ